MKDKKTKDFSKAAKRPIRERFEEERAVGIRRGKFAWGNVDSEAKKAMREKWIKDKQASGRPVVAPAQPEFSEISSDELENILKGETKKKKKD